MISIQNKVIIGATKDDIKYMVQELKNIRKHESDKDLKNKSMECVNPNSVGYCVLFKDFKPYRSMVDTLIKTIDNLNRMSNHNSYQEHSEFMSDIFKRLNYEAGELHKLKEDCKGDYNQYRCLSDAYIRLTDKIYKLELDKPKEKIIPSEIIHNGIINWLIDLGLSSNIISKNKELGLIKYQQDVVEFKGKDAICDWPRNAGKTFTIAKIIELNKPENVLYIDNIGSISSSLDTLCDKFKEINKSNENTGRDTSVEVKVKTSTKLELLVHDRTDYSSEVNVYTLKSLYSGETNRNIVFDYVFFAECLPYNLDVKAEQSISFISYNDKDEWLKRFFPTCKIFKVDYKPLVEVGMLSQIAIDSCKEIEYKKFCNEFAIND